MSFKKIITKLNKIVVSGAESNRNKNSKSGHQKHQILPIMLRPFTQEDLNPVSGEEKPKSPNFIGVGTPKSGTSWWFSLIQQHPDIARHRLFKDEIAVSKETNYFLHFTRKRLNNFEILNYHKAFAVPDGTITGEWSTMYLCHPLCLERIAQVAPHAKIIVMLRNPIDRMVSHVNHVLLNRTQHFNLEAEQAYLFEVYSVYTEAALHSLYAHGLRRLLRYFEPRQILVLQYEKCKANPQQELVRTYRFLEVDDQYEAENYERPVNKQPYLKSMILPEYRESFVDYFIEDVKALKEMFPQVDLTLWSDFAGIQDKI